MPEWAREFRRFADIEDLDVINARCDVTRCDFGDAGGAISQWRPGLARAPTFKAEARASIDLFTIRQGQVLRAINEITGNMALPAGMGRGRIERRPPAKSR
jgi:hypothetical protein